MAYTTINKSTDYFNTKLYTGNGGTNAQTGVGFQPDWLWIKKRNGAVNNLLHDAIRGVTKLLVSNSTAAEDTNTNILTSFDSDGFTVGTNSASNGNNDTYVAWNWKANGAGSTNNDGNRTSTVSASTTAGFSIVRYVGNNSNNQTIGHGLGVAPKMIFIKRLGNIVAGTADWVVYNKTITAAKHLHLNTTAVAVSDNGMFNGVEPTASVFNIHANDDVNKANDQFIAYCFAEKKGYSKIGSYTGNGNANGPFVYTGFKPAFVLIKSSTYGGNWLLWDNKRSLSGGFNTNSYILVPSNNEVEQTGTNYAIDMVSNGFKLRNTNGNVQNNAETMIYMAFAEEPLVANSGTDGVPATAK